MVMYIASIDSIPNDIYEANAISSSVTPDIGVDEGANCSRHLAASAVLYKQGEPAPAGWAAILNIDSDINTPLSQKYNNCDRGYWHLRTK